MEGFKLKIMELTDSGQFECRSSDGEHYHDISLQITCELNNDRCQMVDIENASAIVIPTVSTNTATISTRIDGDGHNSSNHSINATHNELKNNNLRNNTTTTSTAISAHTLPAAAETLSARNSSAHENNNENSNVDNYSDVSVFSTRHADSVVVNRLVARQVVDDKSKRFRSNYAYLNIFSR